MGSPLSPGSRMHIGMHGLLQRKRRQMQRVYTSFITPTCYFRYTQWQFEVRISICTNDVSFIVHRFFTSLLYSHRSGSDSENWYVLILNSNVNELCDDDRDDSFCSMLFHILAVTAGNADQLATILLQSDYYV